MTNRTFDAAASDCHAGPITSIFDGLTMLILLSQAAFHFRQA